MKTYVGRRIRVDGEADGVGVTVETDGCSRPLKAFDHSPTVFEFGAGDHGPSDLTLLLLRECGVDSNEAVKLHRALIRELTKLFDQPEWSLTETELDAMIARVKARERAV